MTDSYDSGGALVPLEDTTPALPAEKPPLTIQDLELIQGDGSNVAVTTDDDAGDAYSLVPSDGDGERELAQYDEELAASFPQVDGHRWKREDRPILESFTQVADEIGLSAEQSNALAAWFVQDVPAVVEDASPADVSEYFFEGVDDAAGDNPLVAGLAENFKEMAVGAGMSTEYAANLVGWFRSQAKNLVTAADAQHREESVEELRAAWGSSHGANVKTTQAWLNSLGETGKILKGARTADGRRLIFAPGIAELLYEFAVAEQPTEAKSGVTSETRYERDLRKEAEAIRSLRAKDRDAYFAKSWRDSNASAADRLIQIESELEARARGLPQRSLAQKSRDLQEEKRALLKLEKTDPEVFMHGLWRRSGISPEQRLHEIATRGR